MRVFRVSRPLCTADQRRHIAIARRALQRAGITVPHPGAHVFRHAVATEMVRSGASFPQVADVLGHESLQTTALYAKLDLDSLSQLTLPWPGGDQ